MKCHHCGETRADVHKSRMALYNRGLLAPVCCGPFVVVRRTGFEIREWRTGYETVLRIATESEAWQTAFDIHTGRLYGVLLPA